MTTEVSPPTAAAPGTQTVGELAEPALLVHAGTTAARVDALLRRDAALCGVVVDVPDAPVLVERSWFEALVAGREGRSVLSSARPVAGLVTSETLVVDANSSVAAVSSVVMDRGVAGLLPEHVVVRWCDGRLGLLRATRLFERVAQHFVRQSQLDGLTGLPNRAHLAHRLHEAAAVGRLVSLLYLDLDHFEVVNEVHGHACGDQVLAQFGARLLATVRADDVAVRIGGDEFAVLRTGDDSVAATTAMADRLLVEAAAPFEVVLDDGSTRLVTVGASIGVAHGEPGDLVRQADAAMDLAKSRGRGRVAVAERSTSPRLDTLDARLRRAIEDGSIEVHVQPVVHLPTGRVVAHEALARWHDGTRQVPPVEFISMAERNGLVADLGRVVLERACTIAASWEGPDAPTISVNVSPLELVDPGFADGVARVLRRTGLEPGRLCLELTETAAVTDLAATAEQLRRLREHGVVLALDDFGTGYSSLTLLRRLPVDVLKVDRSFVSLLGSSHEDAVIVRLIVEAAHALGLLVCAEGVEEPEQRDVLAEMGCDLVQGWLFGRPVAAAG